MITITMQMNYLASYCYYTESVFSSSSFTCILCGVAGSPPALFWLFALLLPMFCCLPSHCILILSLFCLCLLSFSRCHFLSLSLYHIDSRFWLCSCVCFHSFHSHSQIRILWASNSCGKFNHYSSQFMYGIVSLTFPNSYWFVLFDPYMLFHCHYLLHCHSNHPCHYPRYRCITVNL